MRAITLFEHFSEKSKLPDSCEPWGKKNFEGEEQGRLRTLRKNPPVEHWTENFIANCIANFNVIVKIKYFKHD